MEVSDIFSSFMFNMQRDYQDEYLRRQVGQLKDELYVANTLIDTLSGELMTTRERGNTRLGYLGLLDERLKKVEERLSELERKMEEKGKEEQREERRDGYLEGDVHFCVPYGNQALFPGDDADSLRGVCDDMYEEEELPDDDPYTNYDDDDDEVEVMVGPKPKAKRVTKAGKKEKDKPKPILRKKKPTTVVTEVPTQTPISEVLKQEPDSQPDTPLNF